MGVKGLCHLAAEAAECASTAVQQAYHSAPNVQPTTNLSLKQPGTQGHKGVNPACSTDRVQELYTS